MRVVLAGPRGFCAGVEMAITALDRALKTLPRPVYAYHEIVHNVSVVRDFEARGVRFVDEVDQVPFGSTVVFSAHGVSPTVRAAAEARGLLVVDATCPLVSKVHAEARHLAEGGFTILLIGHSGHDETVGIMGEAPGSVTLVEDEAAARSVQVADPQKVAYVTQTTLSTTDTALIVAILQSRFPSIRGPKTPDICFATENRQQALNQLGRSADVVLIIGSRNSSNTNRLVEEGTRVGTPSYRIDRPEDIDQAWISDASTVLLSAGASVPEQLVQDTVAWLQERYSVALSEARLLEEDVEFRLPIQVRDVSPTPGGVRESPG